MYTQHRTHTHHSSMSLWVVPSSTLTTTILGGGGWGAFGRGLPGNDGGGNCIAHFDDTLFMQSREEKQYAIIQPWAQGGNAWGSRTHGGFNHTHTHTPQHLPPYFCSKSLSRLLL